MRKPTFLFYNIGGDFLGVQLRVQEEGFKTVAYYDPEVLKNNPDTGKGMVDLVCDPFDTINKFMSHPDDLIILIDDNARGDLCDSLRKMGFPVIGSSHLSDELEHEREDGNKLAEKIGMTLPKTHGFSDFQSGRDFLAKRDPSEKFVFKGDGIDMAGSSKTHVGISVPELTRFMNWVEKDSVKKGYHCDRFELQEVVDGIEVDIASWFNGEKFSDIGAVCFEQKKIDGLGAPQGCYGQVLTYSPLENPYKGYFNELTGEIKEGGSNEWAINSIVSHKDHDPNFLEWTPRFGWDSTFGELALLQDAGIPISQFLMRVAYGRPVDKILPVGRFSASVRLFSESTGTPGKETCGKPIWVDKSIEKNIWYYSVRKDDDGDMTITGTAFAVATACGDTPEEAVAKVYALLAPEKGLIVTPDIFYSHTIGKGVGETLRKLREYSILSDY